MAVEDEGAQGSIGVPRGRRHNADDGLENLLDVGAGLGTNGNDVFAGDANEVLDLTGDVDGLGCR
jgi:hypothetical protein